MFLKPSKTEPPLPGRIARDGGTAWVDFVGDQPVFTSEGTARFVVERFRRIPFLKPRIEALPQGRAVPPSRPMRGADRVRLDLGGETLRWNYDPDANLGLPMRVLIVVAGLGTVLSCAGACLMVTVDIAAKLTLLYYGGTGASTGQVATEIRTGYDDLYPEKAMMSDFLKALLQARKNGEDTAAFAEKWKSDHPMTKTRAELAK